MLFFGHRGSLKWGKRFPFGITGYPLGRWQVRCMYIFLIPHIDAFLWCVHSTIHRQHRIAFAPIMHSTRHAISLRLIMLHACSPQRLQYRMQMAPHVNLSSLFLATTNSHRPLPSRILHLAVIILATYVDRDAKILIRDAVVMGLLRDEYEK